MEVVKGEVNNLVRRAVGFIITLVILGIISAIITRLPGMETIVFDYITIADIASVVVSVAILVLVFIFGQDMAFRGSRMLPAFPEINPIINNITLIVVIVIAYKSFEKVLSPFLDDLGIPWIYPVILLCIAIYPVYRLVAVLFTSSGKITDLIMGERQAVSTGESVTCPKCGSVVPKSKFCSRCGEDMTRLEDKVGDTCKQCGAAMEKGAKFCVSCGGKVEEPPKSQENRCGKCNSIILPNDEFCSNCGAKVGVSQ